MHTPSAIIAMLCVATAMPAFADQVFIGRATVTAASSGCATKPLHIVEVGETANVAYHPATTGSDAAPESLAILNDFRALYVKPVSPGVLNGQGYYKGVKIGVLGTLAVYDGAYDLSITPVSSGVMILSGRLTKAFGVENCNISLQAVLGLRPG